MGIEKYSISIIVLLNGAISLIFISACLNMSHHRHAKITLNILIDVNNAVVQVWKPLALGLSSCDQLVDDVMAKDSLINIPAVNAEVQVKPSKVKG